MQHGPAQPTSTEHETTAAEHGAGAVVAEPDREMSASESLVHALNDGGTGLLFLGGVLIALIVVMRGMRKGSGRRTAQTREMSDPGSRLASLHEEAAASTGPARKTMLELEETARRFAALLDTKAAKLEILIEHADERLAKLSEALPKDQRPETPRVRGVRPEALDRARVEEDQATRSTAREPDPVHEESRPDQRGTIRIEDAPERPSRVKTTQDIVSELADQGLDAAAIAKEIERPVGQVELMLNIWRNSG